MKTKMKFFAALVIMMGFTMSAMAQSPQTANANIDSKAQVIAKIEVLAGNALQFGLVTQNVPKTISSSGAILQGNPGTGTNGAEQVGTFTVKKGVNTLVTLTFSKTNLFDEASTPNELVFNYADYSSTKLAKLNATTLTDLAFTPTDALSIINDGATAPYFATGEFNVNIGGTVVPGPSQAQGEYTGSITLTATYN